MYFISSRHACLYGGIVGTYQILGIQNVVYSEKYNGKEGNKCFKRFIFSCIFTQMKLRAQMGLFYASKRGILVSVRSLILNSVCKLCFEYIVYHFLSHLSEST